MDDKTLQANAIHEAGHAVALYLQFDLEELHRLVEIRIGEDGSNFLCVVDMFDPSIEEEEMEAIMYCAGYAALIVEQYSEDEALVGTEDDFERAVAKSSTPLDNLKNAAVILLSREKARFLVKTLSNLLVKETNLSAAYLYKFFLEEDLL